MSMKKKKPKQCLMHLKPVDKASRIIGAFDCETSSLISDEVYVTWAPPKEFGFDDVYDAYDFTDFAKWLHKWQNHPVVTGTTVWYAHNMSFDMVRLLPKLREVFKAEDNWSVDGIDLGYTGDRLYQIIVKESVVAKGQKAKEITFRDSMALLNPGTSLEQFAEAMQVGKKRKDLICFEDGDTFDVTNEAHKLYAREDSIILRDAVVKFNKLMVKIFGVEIKGTSSSTALDAWLVTLTDGQKYYSVEPYSKLEIYGREAYKGGLVTLGPNCLDKQPSVKSDINSAYPDAMREYEMPVGTPALVYHYTSGDVGLYRCEVNIPEGEVSFLLTRDDAGNLLAPTGKFKGTFTSTELELLSTTKGTFKVLEGLKFDKTENAFKVFVDKCEVERIRIQEALELVEHKSPEWQALKAEEMVIKIMQNGVYGKFGTKRTFVGKKYGRLDDENYCGTNADEVALGLPTMYDVISVTTPRYSIPHWAAFITAAVRCKLAKVFIAAGLENTLYGDTDSTALTHEGYERAAAKFPELFVKSEANLNGRKYGFFKHEGTYTEFKVIGPKVYTYFEEDHYGGACKGIPKKAIKNYLRPVDVKPSQYKSGKQEFYKAMMNDTETLKEFTFTYESTSNFNASILNGTSATEAKRHLSDLDNSGRYQVVEGKVYPKSPQGQKDIFKMFDKEAA